ncbi:aldo/keto reductase, partial [Corallococcus sp. CA041A]|uniref:aldo/keto reductase n=1 Tax=Corallococcus sp. CA041A TaxID=2316727 RepID=UPI0034CD84D9
MFEQVRHARLAVALAWTLRDPAVTAAIVGARSAKQVEGFIHAGDFRLTSEEVRE